jgi:hypothetical protein
MTRTGHVALVEGSLREIAVQAKNAISLDFIW